MSKLIVLISALTLTACAGSGSGSSAGPVAGTPTIDQPSLTPQSVTLKRGDGFECFVLKGALWCRGSNFRLPSVNATFSQVATGPISSLTVWDDSLCFEARVLRQPINRALGTATYCAGEATFDSRYSSFPVLYGSGFSQDPTRDGSNDLTSREHLISGADMSLTTFVTSGIVTDGTSHTSTETVLCSIEDATLTCPTFSIGGI